MKALSGGLSKIQYTSPERGADPWFSAYVDFGQCDVTPAFRGNGMPLGRFWMSVLLDDCFDRVLASNIGFAPPNDQTVMFLAADCMRRNGRLPITIAVSNQRGFRSEQMCTRLATLGVNLNFLSIGKPVRRTIVEGLLQDFKTSLQASGCSFKGKAVWDLESVSQAAERYLHDIYDQETLVNCGATRREAYLHRGETCGVRPYSST